MVIDTMKEQLQKQLKAKERLQHQLRQDHLKLFLPLNIRIYFLHLLICNF